MTKKNIQQTLVLIKPESLMKSLTGNIITSLSHPSRKIMGVKVVQVTKELAEEHYQHLKDADFFNELINYIMGEFHTKRVLALVYEGENASENEDEAKREIKLWFRPDELIHTIYPVDKKEVTKTEFFWRED